MEYIAPLVLAIYMLLSNVFRCQIMKVNKQLGFFTYNSNLMLWKDFWHILLIYFIIELVLEAVCSAIRRVSSYERVSAIGNLGWGSLFIMILHVGSTATYVSSTTEYLKVI